jgi:protein-disulfide isomerase
MAREQVEGLYKQRFDATSAKSIPLDGSPARGPDAAAVTLVEFADFECPFCQHIAPQLDDLVEKKKPRLRFVFKFMPLAMHPHSELAAGAAVAAEMQGKFWEMHDLLFANGSRLEPSDLEEYARAIGLDLDRFRQDVASPVVKERIAADRKLADDLGVRATPTIFINGRNYDLQANLDDWIDGEIAAGASP